MKIKGRKLLLDDGYEPLYELLFHRRGPRYSIYLAVFVVSLAYACVADFFFNRPMEAVALEAAVLMASLLVSAPLAYLGLSRRNEWSKVGVMLPPEIKRAYENIASEEHIPLSDVMTRVVIEYVEQEAERSRSRRSIIGLSKALMNSATKKRV